MTHRKDLSLLRDALLSLPRSESITPRCLADEKLAALAEASLTPGERGDALEHLASCQRCRSAVVAVSRALADRQVAREVARVERLPRTRFLPVIAPLAAAAALLLLLVPPRAPESGPGHRAPDITTAAAPVPTAPVGAVGEARSLAWKAVPGADRYRVTLFASGGTVLYETQLSDTVAALPASIDLLRGQRYLWKVEARTGFDRWVASALVEFTVAAEPPR